MEKPKNQLNIPGLFYLAANDIAAKETLAHFLQNQPSGYHRAKMAVCPLSIIER